MNSRHLFGKAFITFLYFSSISIGSILGYFLTYSNRLPQIEQLEKYDPAVPSQVRSANGKLIGEFYVEKRVLVNSINKISPLFLQALIAIEDSHFFEHPGIDPAGILRALYVNLRSGRTVQ